MDEHKFLQDLIEDLLKSDDKNSADIKQLAADVQEALKKTSSHEAGVHKRSVVPPRTTPKMENKESSAMGDDIRSSHLFPKSGSVHNYNTKAMGNAKASAMAILKQLKQMPKPNLPKSEDIEKAQSPDKGVHQPHFMAGKKTGTSDIGARVMPDIKPIGSTKQYIKEKHQQVLGELKSMPKPNLPKSEGMEKSDPKTKLPGVLLDKATSVPAPPPPQPHLPKMNITKPRQPSIKAPGQQSPAIQKAESLQKLCKWLDKCNSVKKASQSESDAMSSKGYSEKGTHVPVHVGNIDGKSKYQEQSLAGKHVRRGDSSKAKALVQAVTNELKSMPKPNLPKSEDSDQSLKKASFRNKPEAQEADKPIPGIKIHGGGESKQATLRDIVSFMQKQKGGSKSAKPEPSHLDAALHHASWWAGHQGMHDTMMDPDQNPPDEDSYDEQGNIREDYDHEQHLESLAEETGHLPKADHHLSMAKRHLAAAGVIDPEGHINWDHPALEKYGHVSPFDSEWDSNQSMAHKLLDAIDGRAPGQAISHIDGTHISHFGPDAGDHKFGGKNSHIASYAHESFGDEHPLDKKLQG